MKKNWFLLLACLLCMFSCEEDSNGGDVYKGDYNIIYDAATLEGMDFSASSAKDHSKHELTVTSYPDIDYLKVQFVYSNLAPESTELHKAFTEYCSERTAFIQEAYYRYKQETGNVNYEMPYLFSAYVDGIVKITSDKTLFGKQPGENLIAYFDVVSKPACVVCGRETPRLLYGFQDAKPQCFADYCVKDAWFQPDYKIRLSQIPDEKYEDVTLTISFPVSREYLKDYVKDRLKGGYADIKVVNEVLTSSCKLHFVQTK